MERAAVRLDKKMRNAVRSCDGLKDGFGAVFGKITGMIFFRQQVGADGCDGEFHD